MSHKPSAKTRNTPFCFVIGHSPHYWPWSLRWWQDLDLPNQTTWRVIKASGIRIVAFLCVVFISISGILYPLKWYVHSTMWTHLTFPDMVPWYKNTFDYVCLSYRQWSSRNLYTPCARIWTSVEKLNRLSSRCNSSISWLPQTFTMSIHFLWYGCYHVYCKV